MLLIHPERLVESGGVVGGVVISSELRTLGALIGDVGAALHAEMTREATATTASVRWRRDMGDSDVG